MLDAPIFTPRIRGNISRAVHADQSWRGTRKGIKIEIDKAQRALFEDRKAIVWKARIRKLWKTGTAPTVYDALTQIETLADRALIRQTGAA